MEVEKDILRLVSKNDRSHLQERELLQESKQEKIERLQQDLLSPREQKINI
jgi:hypothetical protein